MGTGSHPLILIASKVPRSFCDTWLQPQPRGERGGLPWILL